MTILAIIVFLVCTITLVLVEPKVPSKDQYGPFFARNFAHRGLHNIKENIPENTIAAFHRAKEHGYGIELDIRFTKDKRIVVFHDDGLKRACGVKKNVNEFTFDELENFGLFGTDHKIPLFSDVLKEIGGAVPMIVEFKSTMSDYKELCQDAWKMLSSYEGQFCIESFDPRVVAWFNKHHANVFRGQLTSSVRDLSGGTSKIFAFAISNVLTNVIARPHFIAHSTDKKSPMVILCQWLGAKRFIWTVRDPALADKYELENDGVIFENYLPKPKFYKETGER